MKKVARIGLVGAGWWACQFHIPHLLENKNVELVAISRLGNAELRDIQSRFNIEHGSENHSEIYKYDLDGVVIASPHVEHAEHSKVALENDCHVLVEKPLCTKTKDCLEIEKLTKNYPSVFWIAMELLKILKNQPKRKKIIIFVG